MIAEMPVAAIGVRMGMIRNAEGRISPTAPITSLMPMNRTVVSLKALTKDKLSESGCQ
jgi:hypothetical protein